jgi:hypothetical protein
MEQWNKHRRILLLRYVTQNKAVGSSDHLEVSAETLTVLTEAFVILLSSCKEMLG